MLFRSCAGAMRFVSAFSVLPTLILNLTCDIPAGPWCTGLIARHTDSSPGVAAKMSSQVESAPPRMPTTATMMSTERTVPIVHRMGHSATPASGDPMEVTSPAVPSQPIVPTMGPPPSRTSPDAGTNGANNSNDHSGGMQEQHQNGNMLTPSSAGGAQGGGGGSGQQPKVQQTAFIHKLYKYEIVKNYVRAIANVLQACWTMQA